MVFRDLIFRNFRRKFFSLALAILIWLTIHFADKQLRPVPVNQPTNSAVTH
jgi:hypothetical protein